MTTKALLAHAAGQRLHAEDDAVDVDAEDAPVVVDRPVALRQDARVQADEVGRLDVGPRERIRDVEAVDQVEPRTFVPPASSAATSARPIPRPRP